jgi:hypothetical protein
MNSADADGSLKDRTVRSLSNANWPLTLANWRTIADRVRQRVEFGDLLLYLYVLTISRQCFWSIPHNRLAWLLSIFVAAFCWIAYVVTKDTEDTSRQLSLWLVVGLPLLFVYLLRVVFPDVSFDVINHHLFLGERALEGPLLLPADFFPTPAPYNPAPDMLTGIFRHILGYRLGTLINLLVLLWAAQILDKLLRSYVRNNWLRAVCVLLCLLAEQILFEINNYMVDLIALPLTLEATRLTLLVDNWKPYRRRLVRIAFLCGLAVALKLTNAAMVAPIVLACAGLTLFKFKPAIKTLTTTFVLTASAFVASLLPYCIYIYLETGSPFFPVYNAIFRSPYWPLSNVWDPRWGPPNAREVLLWPLLLLARAERLSELNAYSGRITLAVIAALIFVIFCWRRADLRSRTLCFIVIGTAFLWSMTTGYVRYALHLEALSSVLVIVVTVSLRRDPAFKTRALRLMISTLLWLALGCQAVFACIFISQKEWSMRGTVFQYPRPYLDSAPNLLRDHSIRKFLTAAEQARYDGVDVWIVSGEKTVGPEVMLKGNVPFINVRVGEYFNSRGGSERFAQALAGARNKRMASLAFVEDYHLAVAALRARGLAPSQVVDVEIPFFSANHRIPMKFFEVKEIAVSESSTSAATNALPEGGYRALITLANKPAAMKAGEKKQLLIKVKNDGNSIWPWRVEKGWMGIVTAGDRWLSKDGLTALDELDRRVALPHDLGPGEEIELKLTVTAPDAPGDYMLEIDMVHEGITWFSQHGSPTARWNVRIE